LIAKDFAEKLQRIDHRVLNGAARNCKGSRAVEVRDAQVEIDLEIVARIPGGESGDVESLERRPPVRRSGVPIARSNDAKRPLAIVARKDDRLTLEVNETRRRVPVGVRAREADSQLQIAGEIARGLRPVLVAV